MINVEDKTKEIEEKFQDATNKANELLKSLNDLRMITVENVDKDNQEEIQKAINLGRDIDSRVAYILRAILIQHGNVLFI